MKESNEGRNRVKVKKGGIMEKDLEKFIAARRAEFDDQPVPESIWEGVFAGLEARESQSAEGRSVPAQGEFATAQGKTATVQGKSVPVHERSAGPRPLWKGWLRIAAGVILTGSIGVSIYFYGRQQGYEDYARINPELAASRAGYQQLVTQRKDSVLVFVHRNPGLGSEFADALSYMESNYETLKRELAFSPNQERTLAAMIMNLQAQAEVLNQQLIILSKLTNEQNEKL